MQRIDTATRALSLFGAGKDGFADGNQALGVNATAFDAAWCNAVQEEIAAPIEALGMALDPNNRGQLLAAIRQLIEVGAGNYALDTGVANAYVVALNPAVAAYNNNYTFRMKVAHANTGACTVDFGAGPVPLLNDDAGALAGGDLQAGMVLAISYVQADGKAYVTSLVQSQGDARYLLQVNNTVGLVETFGAAGGALDRRYNDVANISGMQYNGANINAEYMTVNNAAYNTGTGTWAGRDVAGPCWAEVMTDAGQKLWYFAVTGAAGVAPAWTLMFVLDLAGGAFLGNGPAIKGASKNYAGSAIGLNNYNYVVTADEVVLENSANQARTVRGVNLTINANGVVGNPLSIMSARAASTWYYIWLWYNATLGLTATLDVSPTAPTAPAGYAATDFSAMMRDACRTDGSANTYLLQTKTDSSGYSQYVPLAGSNLTALPAMVTGTIGSGATSTTPTWAAVGTASFVPPTANGIRLVAQSDSSGSIVAAPNTTYGGIDARASNPAPLGCFGSTYSAANAMGEFGLESSNIYCASGTPYGTLQCMGWKNK